MELTTWINNQMMITCTIFYEPMLTEEIRKEKDKDISFQLYRTGEMSITVNLCCCLKKIYDTLFIPKYTSNGSIVTSVRYIRFHQLAGIGPEQENRLYISGQL